MKSMSCRCRRNSWVRRCFRKSSSWSTKRAV